MLSVYVNVVFTPLAHIRLYDCFVQLCECYEIFENHAHIAY